MNDRTAVSKLIGTNSWLCWSLMITAIPWACQNLLNRPSWRNWKTFKLTLLLSLWWSSVWQMVRNTVTLRILWLFYFQTVCLPLVKFQQKTRTTLLVEMNYIGAKIFKIVDLMFSSEQKRWQGATLIDKATDAVKYKGRRRIWGYGCSSVG